MLFVYLFALLTINTGEKKVTDEKEWRRKDKIMMMSEAFKMSYDVIAKSDKCKPLGEKGGEWSKWQRACVQIHCEKLFLLKLKINRVLELEVEV